MTLFQLSKQCFSHKMSGQDKQVAIVTGANSGIGLEVTKLLGANGYIVVMACRSMERANKAIVDMKNESNIGGLFVPMILDLGDLDSVHKFVFEFRANFSRLDVLINNAGVSADYTSYVRHVNSRGIELTVATNHLGHFLLTNLLLPMLRDTARIHGAARILIVSSVMHKLKHYRNMDFMDFNLEKPGAYSAGQAYKNSKTMNILHARKLSRMLQGTNVYVNSIHPGVIPSTGLVRGVVSCLLSCCLESLCCCCRITRTAEEAGRHMFNISTGMPPYQDKTGLYFYDGLPAQISDEAQLPANEDRVWEWSEIVTAT